MDIGQVATDTLVEAAALSLMESYPSHSVDSKAYRKAWIDGFATAAGQVIGLNKFQFGELVLGRLAAVYKDGPRMQEFRDITGLVNSQ